MQAYGCRKLLLTNILKQFNKLEVVITRFQRPVAINLNFIASNALFLIYLLRKIVALLSQISKVNILLKQHSIFNVQNGYNPIAIDFMSKDNGRKRYWFVSNGININIEVANIEVLNLVVNKTLLL